MIVVFAIAGLPNENALSQAQIYATENQDAII